VSSTRITKPTRYGGLARYIPILSWLPTYNRGWLSADVIAGLTLWGLVVPEAMAYAGVAGLPPQAGLYTLLAALLVYALLGTSRHLVVQATSATAALLASSVMGVLVTRALVDEGATPDPALYQAYASAFVLVVGVVFLLAGAARLGFITQFLSKPVMDGFVIGLALFVAVGQLNKLFGVPKGEGNTVEKLIAIVRELPQANWITFAMGASALALLFLLPRWNKKIPAGLVVLFGYIALSTVLGLNANYGVEVVGSLPQGLPKFTLPLVPPTAFLAMIAPAIGVLLVAYSEALGVAREFGEKHGYEVDPNQELNAHAVANLVSSLFGGMIAAGSMSASAVKEGAGARSQVANLVTWGMAVVTVLFLTPLFQNLPEAVLAALIIHALWHILASRKLYRVRMISRTEFWLGVITFLGVILIDVLQGMLLGLLCSILLVIYRSSRPHLASLGRVPGVPGAYSDLTRHPENTPVPGVLIVRLDTPMYFANALTIRDQVKALVAEAETPPRALIFDFAVQDRLDITSADVLKGLVKEFREKGIAVYAAEVHARVIEFARRAGLLDAIGAAYIFPTVDAALAALHARADGIPNPAPNSKETNS
jgi:high affinity sulfate transporter 1